MATIRSPARDQRDQGRVDRGHAGGERETVLGALQLGDGPREGGGRRVVDPAVGVARVAAGQDVAELSRVVAGERDGLVDRDRGRTLVDPRQSVGRPDRPGRESLSRGDARGPAVAG